ncbi:MAG TPA: O-antigen ligase family protein [Pseudolabrys sp.]|nr:O-antigen ligase family protein [Pseudolabrys sp.]
MLTPAGGLPVLLVLLGVAGCAWADVSWFERWKGFDSFVKLLAIPFLLTQFRRSERGAWVFAGYLFSCVALVMASFIVLAIPALADRLMHTDYVLVKNAATQSGEFVTCIFGLLYLALARNGSQTRLVLFGIALVVVAMLASIFYVATGRTALVVFLILLILFATRTLPAKGIAVVASVAILVGGTAWISSPYLRGRTQAIWTDLDHYAASYTMTSSGERLVFWTKSIDFIRQSPFAGHGTGSIHSQFQKSAAGQTGAAGEASTNPHNQTFAVGIQLGLVGIIVLWAMWIAHLAMFRGDHLVSWIGVVVVIQNVVGSLFNSHLFDFVQGWTYVVGVGVAGGMMLGAKRRE